MMLNLKVCLAICCSFYIIQNAQAGIILNRIKSIATGAKCTLHKVGNYIYPHVHDGNCCPEEFETTTEVDFGNFRTTSAHSNEAISSSTHRNFRTSSSTRSSTSEDFGNFRTTSDYSNEVRSSTQRTFYSTSSSTGYGRTTTTRTSSGTSTPYPRIDIRAEASPVQNNQAVGKRLISGADNCEEGYRADSSGVCREEY